MKKLLLASAFLLAACGDNLQPTDDQASLGSDEDTTSVPDPTAPALVAGFIYEPQDCFDHSLRFEGHYGYTDGTVIENPICRYDFSDGTYAEGCRVSHSLPTAVDVVFTVTDPATGATGSSSEGNVIGPRSFDTSLAVTTDGLSISWETHAIYGDSPDVGNTHISITPSENVIVEDPSILFDSTGTVAVTAAGTYTVRVDAAINFGDVGGCTAFTEKTIEVVCNEPHAP